MNAGALTTRQTRYTWTVLHRCPAHSQIDRHHASGHPRTPQSAATDALARRCTPSRTPSQHVRGQLEGRRQHAGVHRSAEAAQQQQRFGAGNSPATMQCQRKCLHAQACSGEGRGPDTSLKEASHTPTCAQTSAPTVLGVHAALMPRSDYTGADEDRVHNFPPHESGMIQQHETLPIYGGRALRYASWLAEERDRTCGCGRQSAYALLFVRDVVHCCTSMKRVVVTPNYVIVGELPHLPGTMISRQSTQHVALPQQ
jgi:hypothetical protein